MEQKLSINTMSKRKRSNNTILCVKNFPDYLQSEDLKQYFKEIGNIKDITIFFDKQSRAKAYIEYTKELTEEALKFNRATIENERISLRFTIPQDRDVIVSNVPHTLSIDDLKSEYMENIGKVENIEKISNTTYKVRFETIQSTREAIDYNGADIEGHVVSIQQLQLSPQELQKILLELDINEEDTKESSQEVLKPNKKQKISEEKNEKKDKKEKNEKSESKTPEKKNSVEKTPDKSSKNTPKSSKKSSKGTPTPKKQ